MAIYNLWDFGGYSWRSLGVNREQTNTQTELYIAIDILAEKPNEGGLLCSDSHEHEHACLWTGAQLRRAPQHWCLKTMCPPYLLAFLRKPQAKIQDGRWRVPLARAPQQQLIHARWPPVNKPSTDIGLCIQAIVILGTMFPSQQTWILSLPSGVRGLMPVNAFCVTGMCYQYSLHFNSALLQQLLQQVLQFVGHLFKLITVSCPKACVHLIC